MSQSITDLRRGRVVAHEGEPYLILTNSFMRTAQRKPVMRTKLRGLMSGKVISKTYIAGENFELVQIEKSNAQFMYKDDVFANFMDNTTYDQFQLSLEMVGDALQYLKEGEETIITKYEGKPIGIELPVKVALKVTDTMPGVRGDTAQSGTKPATLETGLVVQVPLFVNVGEMIRVNTDTGEYVERAQAL